MKSFEEREKALENDIERVGGQTIQKMRQAVKAAVSRHSGIQKEISATKVKLRAAKKAIVSCDEESGKFSKGIEDSEQAILAAKTQFELIEKEAATVLASFELAQKAQKEREKEEEKKSPTGIDLKTALSIVALLRERSKDINAFVRAAALRSLNSLVLEGRLPVIETISVTRCAMERIRDKAVLVRKNAILVCV